MVISSLLCVTCPVLTHGMLHAYMHLYTDGSVVRLGRGHLESAKHLGVQALNVLCVIYSTYLTLLTQLAITHCKLDGYSPSLPLLVYKLYHNPHCTHEHFAHLFQPLSGVVQC